MNATPKSGIVRIATMSCPFHRPAPSYASTTPVSLARYPQESWLLGSASAVARNGLEFFERCEQTAGIVRTRFLVKRVYVVTDPTAIADVLVNHPKSFVKPFLLRRMRVLFGNGLLTSSGEHWAKYRHLVQPAFGAECMPEFLRLVRESTEEMLSSWCEGERRVGERGAGESRTGESCDEDVHDVYSEIVDLCMKNVAQTMFGVYDEELGSIVRALAATCHDLTHAVLNVGQLLPFHLPRRLKRRLKTELGALNNYLGRLIDQRINDQRINDQRMNDLRRNEPPRRDFLGLLLSSGGKHGPPVNRQAVLDESVTMLLAGHETTASALAWSLYLLARHPKHADALASDLVSHLQGDAPSMSDLENDLEDLTSLRATLDETLRLYPPTHRIGRTVVSPVVVGGHEIPVGADVLVPQWAVHRSARWYDRPLEFLPERWTPAFRRSLPKFAYFPFSGGPRICVGTQLAYSEVAVILGMLAQRFRYSLCDETPLVPYEGLTLLPAGGHLRLKIKRRMIPTAPKHAAELVYS